MNIRFILACVISVALFFSTMMESLACPKPYGVNLGGVFVLEDWFFSNASQDTYVATPCEAGEHGGLARSTIFLQQNQTKGFYWTSETHFIQQLLQKGYSEKQIAAYFNYHRKTYLLRENGQLDSLDKNFARIKAMGISAIRLPITWAITYPDHAYSIDPGHGKPIITIPATTHVVLIKDPFYPSLKWASIPIGDVEAILKKAHQYGLKVIIDIHAFTGGSGAGTYNGVWPNPPLFWTTGKDKKGHFIYEKNFQTIVGNLISWADGLYKQKDLSAAQGLLGILPMNEPAHLLGIPAARCYPSANWGISSYQPVFNTLGIAVDDFRHSELPSHHVQLVMNVIETALPNKDSNDLIYKTIGSWWKSITTKKERQTWADLDIHHYVAWDSHCNRCLMEDVKNNEIQASGFARIHECSNWYLTLRNKLGLSEHALLSTTEFSASTNNNTALSCASGHVLSPNKTPKNYLAYRNYFLETQLTNAKKAHIPLYFWTWMVPYNSNFQNEWSLNHICTRAQMPAFCKK